MADARMQTTTDLTLWSCPGARYVVQVADPVARVSLYFIKVFLASKQLYLMRGFLAPTAPSEYRPGNTAPVTLWRAEVSQSISLSQPPSPMTARPRTSPRGEFHVSCFMIHVS